MSLNGAASGVTSRAITFSMQGHTCEDADRKTRAPVELATTSIPEAYTCQGDGEEISACCA